MLAQDSEAVAPAVQAAVSEGIPVIGYDRLIENPDAFYLTFDNKEVGRMQAQGVFAVQPKGNYVFIKGNGADPNADFLFAGQMEVLKAAIYAGDIVNVGEAYTDNWNPEVAQANMEQFLTANDNKVDAVVASNDGTAGGAIAALTAQGLAGSVPVSGQDGDHAALNGIALATQTVSVWKDARELGKKAAEIAVALAGGTALDAVPGAIKFNGGPKGVEMNAVLLAPCRSPGTTSAPSSTPAGYPRTSSARACRPAPSLSAADPTAPRPRMPAASSRATGSSCPSGRSRR